MKSSMLVGVRCSPYFRPTKAVGWISLGVLGLAERRADMLFHNAAAPFRSHQHAR